MLNTKDSRKIGRPKLADTPLKKKSMIAVAICFVIAAILSIMGAYYLDLIPGVTRLRGTIYKEYSIGEKFCLGTECFYVIEDNGDEVAALAEYNLLVGNYYDSDIDDRVEIDPDTTEGYGLQSEKTNNSSYGTVKFADSNYWSNYATTNQYIYSNKSKLYGYIKDYEQILIDSGYPSVKASAIDISKINYLNSKDVAPFYEDGVFWTGTAASSTDVYKVYDGNKRNSSYSYYGYDYVAGVRPFIRIAKEDFAEPIELDDDGYYVGKNLCLDNECFNVISYDDETVTMLAKDSLDYTTMTQTTSNNPKLQFSEDAYWSDDGLIEDYGSSYPANVYGDSTLLKFIFDIYERKLIKSGYTSVRIRGLDYGDLEGLGCSLESNSCSNSPYASWLLTSNEFWLESASSDLKLYTIDASGNINTKKYSEDEFFRPVITIDKSNISEKREMSDEQARYVVGTEVCYENECFNYISNDGNKVRLLAKYNLLIGKNFVVRNGETEEEDVSTSEEEYGRQSHKATGNLESSQNLYAVVPFSSNIYWWNSSTGNYSSEYNVTESVLLKPQTYAYVYDKEKVTFGEEMENYKNYLVNITGKESINVELPKGNDIYGVYTSDNLGYSLPSWYQSAGYWTGVLYGEEDLNVVNGGDSIFDRLKYNDYDGVRVVLTMNKDDYEGIVHHEEEPTEDETTTTTTEEETTTQEDDEAEVVEVVKTITNKLPDTIRQVTNTVNGKKSGVTYTNKKVTSRYVKDVDTNSLAKKINKVTITEGDDTTLFIIACVILSILLATLTVVLLGKDKEKESPVK